MLCYVLPSSSALLNAYHYGKSSDTKLRFIAHSIMYSFPDDIKDILICLRIYQNINDLIEQSGSNANIIVRLIMF